MRVSLAQLCGGPRGERRAACLPPKCQERVHGRGGRTPPSLAPAVPPVIGRAGARLQVKGTLSQVAAVADGLVPTFLWIPDPRSARRVCREGGRV